MITALSLTEDVVLAAVAQAVRAPSMYNVQPWRFGRAGDVIELYADPQRALPVADPTGWAARIACGAAALNLRLALAAIGRPMRVDLLPAPSRPELMATLTPLAARPPAPGEAALARAIDRRRSNRGPFVDTVVSASVRTALVTAAAAEAAVLTYADDPAVLADLGEVVRTADGQLKDRPGYTAELRSWLRADPAATDGIVRQVAGPAPGPTELITRRDFGGPPAPENRRYEATSLVAVLSSPGDTPRDQLVAGQALQRVLLTATDLGIACSLVSQPIEVAAAREELRRLLRRTASPQMVLRLGYGTPAPATGRRPVDDVYSARAGQPR